MNDRIYIWCIYVENPDLQISIDKDKNRYLYRKIGLSEDHLIQLLIIYIFKIKIMLLMNHWRN